MAEYVGPECCPECAGVGSKAWRDKQGIAPCSKCGSPEEEPDYQDAEDYKAWRLARQERQREQFGTDEDAALAQAIAWAPAQPSTWLDAELTMAEARATAALAWATIARELRSITI